MAAQRTNTSAGVGLMAASASLFGVIFLISGVNGVSAEYVLAWRIIALVAINAALLCIPKLRADLREYIGLVRAQRCGWLIVTTLGIFVSVQLWLFMWAPAHGHGLDVSLGYLLLPLILVVAGRWVFRDRMTTGQWVAVGVAACAVALKILLSGGLAWPVLVVISYAPYFTIRRLTKLDHSSGLAVEMAMLVPFATAYLIWQPAHGLTLLDGASIAAIALIGTFALSLYLGASLRLSMPMFGLLSYLEPVVMLGVAMLLGERPSSTDLVVYGMLGLALMVLTGEGLRRTFTASDGHPITRPIPIA